MSYSEFYKAYYKTYQEMGYAPVPVEMSLSALLKGPQCTLEQFENFKQQLRNKGVTNETMQHYGFSGGEFINVKVIDHETIQEVKDILRPIVATGAIVYAAILTAILLRETI